MRLLNRYLCKRGGGFGPLLGFFILWTLFLFPSSVLAAQNAHIKILYFFSTTCRHCIDARPFVIALSKEYSIQGLQFGEGQRAVLPFPVEAGDKKVAQEVYGVAGVPTMAVLVDGKYKQKIAGTPDIQDAKVIIKGLARGAMTVTEAVDKQREGDVIVTGWIIARGEYFKKAHFFLTDRKTELPVKAWLPLEAVKSPVSKKRPQLMSDVIRKPVVLKGIIKKTAAGSIFQVKEELGID
jgi:thiol-disulfide isomerase/thioredoxin